MSQVTNEDEGVTTFSTDSGTANASGDTITISGGSGIDTSGSGSVITVDLETPVSVADGGTGNTSFTDGGVVLGGSTLTDTGVLAKGELLAGDGSGSPTLLSPGSDGLVLSAESSEEMGLKWIEQGGAGMEVSAFGESLVAEVTPQVLIHFPYNLNTDIVNTTTSGSGSVTHSGQLVSVQSGAATSSSSNLFSNKFLEYRPGQGALIRFTAIYGGAVVGNSQIVGSGNTTDGFFFGYNGTDFGIMSRRGSSDTWISQTDWNVDKMDGNGPSQMTLNQQQGNVYQIRYQWLGFGAITFSIENEATGNLQTVHRIAYANNNTLTSINNPSLPYCASSTNTTNNTNVVIKVASVGMFLEGKINNSSYTRNSIDNEKTIGATETNILTIRNKTTYQSVTNLVQIQPDFLSIATDGTKSVHLHVYVNATLGGTPSYNDIRTNNSVVDFDIAGTTVSGGVLVATIPMAKVDGRTLLFNDYDFIMVPGQTLTFAAESSGSNDVLVGISWQERFT